MRGWAAGLGFVLAALAVPASGQAPLAVPPAPQDRTLELEARRLSYDRDSGTVAAEGDVRLRYGPYRLRARQVLYDRETGTVVAQGDVRLQEPGGTVVSGSRVALSGDFRDAAVQRLGLAFADGSRLAAAQGTRTGGRITAMRDVAFSPCRECGPGDEPLWALKAEEVSHDRKTRTITYRDVRFTVLGTPLGFLPYLRHPDPTVTRREGFLAPALLIGSGVGVLARSYYYQPLSPSRDITWEAGVSTRHGPLVGGVYRQRLAAGELQAEGSLTRTGDPPADPTLAPGDLRGHLGATGQFHLNRSWRWGFQSRLSSDPSYLGDYGYGGGSLLANEVRAERFTARRYARLRATAWQDRRAPAARDEVVPVRAPDLSHAGLATPPGLGGTLRWRANLRHLDRGGAGRRVSRAAVAADWQGVRIVGPGLRVRGRAAATGAAYTSAAPADARRQSASFQPIAGVEAAYPLADRRGWGRLELAPRAAAIAAPELVAGAVPREDTSLPELDTINLFALDRAPGFDRTESGYRAVYGLRLGVQRRAGGRAEAFLGRSRALDGAAPFARAGGLDRPASDVVGRLTGRAGPVTLSYRARANPRSGDLPRQEASLSARAAGREASLDYLSLAELGPYSRREELRLSAATPIAAAWRLKASHTHRYDPPRGPARTALTVSYRCDCMQLSVEVARQMTGAERQRENLSASFQLGLKTLGGIGG